MIKVKSVPQ